MTQCFFFYPWKNFSCPWKKTKFCPWKKKVPVKKSEKHSKSAREKTNLPVKIFAKSCPWNSIWCPWKKGKSMPVNSEGGGKLNSDPLFRYISPKTISIYLYLQSTLCTVKRSLNDISLVSKLLEKFGTRMSETKITLEECFFLILKLILKFRPSGIGRISIETSLFKLRYILTLLLRGPVKFFWHFKT